MVVPCNGLALNVPYSTYTAHLTLHTILACAQQYSITHVLITCVSLPQVQHSTRTQPKQPARYFADQPAAVYKFIRGLAAFSPVCSLMPLSTHGTVRQVVEAQEARVDPTALFSLAVRTQPRVIRQWMIVIWCIFATQGASPMQAGKSLSFVCLQNKAPLLCAFLKSESSSNRGVLSPDAVSVLKRCLVRAANALRRAQPADYRIRKRGANQQQFADGDLRKY